jgi:hypothetical protein
MMNEHDAEKLDALERAVLEIDAMISICCDDFTDESQPDGAGEHFVVITPEALGRARTATDSPPPEALLDVPRIDVEAVVRSTCTETSGGATRLRICLPPGYPSTNHAEVTVLSTPKKFPRGHLDQLSKKLQCLSKELLGSEAMMEIINECRDAMESWEEDNKLISDQVSEESCTDKDNVDVTTSTQSISRRWIWVHHITNSSRLKQIVIEAQQLKLGGFLKGGYPGVVIVEGTTRSCDEFVGWIKGNKSRPGGFGRNWGHHVRGEATGMDKRQLPELFEELEEDDMGKLGALCNEFGVEVEFRKFILQHK